MNWKVKVSGVVVINAVIWGGLYYDAHSGRSPASLGSSAKCQSVIDHYKRLGIQIVETTDPKKFPDTAYGATVPVSGPGIISSKPATFVCGTNGNITIFGMGTIIDKDKTREAVKALSAIYLVEGDALKPTEAQKIFFNEIVSKLQPDTEWNEKIEGGFRVRIMTVPADSSGNYMLVVDTGNAI